MHLLQDNCEHQRLVLRFFCAVYHLCFFVRSLLWWLQGTKAHTGLPKLQLEASENMPVQFIGHCCSALVLSLHQTAFPGTLLGLQLPESLITKSKCASESCTRFPSVSCGPAVKNVEMCGVSMGIQIDYHAFSSASRSSHSHQPV